jgi:hypothetical protein
VSTQLLAAAGELAAAAGDADGPTKVAGLAAGEGAAAGLLAGLAAGLAAAADVAAVVGDGLLVLWPGLQALSRNSGPVSASER